MKEPSPLKGRIYILIAAVLWSLSGAFVKLLTKDNPTGLGEPPVAGLAIAFYRALFASLFFLPSLRLADITFRPAMIFMVISFATMNLLFVSALNIGSAANAIILQYTAPIWVVIVNALWLKEASDRRTNIALILGMTGVGVIVIDALRRPTPETLHAVLVALGSGFAYAGVILGLRILRTASSQWLTWLNHAVAALTLLPLVWLWPTPTSGQLAFLVLFGCVQMGIPYWLFSRALKAITMQEAAMICLLEPICNPIWAYLATRDTPDPATLLGGGFILAALAWRYLPRRKEARIV